MQDAPDDFVIATGQINTLRDCVRIADEAGISEPTTLHDLAPYTPTPSTP